MARFADRPMSRQIVVADEGNKLVCYHLLSGYPAHIGPEQQCSISRFLATMIEQPLLLVEQLRQANHPRSIYHFLSHLSSSRLPFKAQNWAPHTLSEELCLCCGQDTLFYDCEPGANLNQTRGASHASLSVHRWDLLMFTHPNCIIGLPLIDPMWLNISSHSGRNYDK